MTTPALFYNAPETHFRRKLPLYMLGQFNDMKLIGGN
jgi:hypothetical protein